MQKREGFLKISVSAVIALMILLTANSVSGLEDAIVNGDFETGNLSGWLRDRSPGGTVEVQSSFVHAGHFGLKIDTPTSNSGDFVYQGISVSEASFQLEFWIYKETGEGHFVELVSDWNQSGSAYGVTVIGFWSNSITFGAWSDSRTAWNGTLTITYTMSSGIWHNVKVNADALSMEQELFIDDAKIVEKTSTLAYVPEWIIIGDISGTAEQGLFYYDDVRLTLSVSPPPPPTVSDFWVGLALGLALIPVIMYLWFKRKQRVIR